MGGEEDGKARSQTAEAATVCDQSVDAGRRAGQTADAPTSDSADLMRKRGDGGMGMRFDLETSYTIRERIGNAPFAVLPIGAVEAHGPHLPLGTDNVLAAWLARELAERGGGLLLPLLPYGQVWSLASFPGSVGISNGTIVSLVTEIGRHLHAQGVNKLAIVNGHLGNAAALKEASRRLYEDVPRLKTFVFFYPGTSDVIRRVCESPRPHKDYFHACEIETSCMLHAAPELVDMGKAIDDVPDIPDTVDMTPTPWETFTSTAVLGKATLADAAKGRAILEQAVSVMLKALNSPPPAAADAKANANEPTSKTGGAAEDGYGGPI
jgi:creatinine amidohydrolase